MTHRWFNMTTAFWCRFLQFSYFIFDQYLCCVWQLWLVIFPTTVFLNFQLDSYIQHLEPVRVSALENIYLTLELQHTDVVHLKELFQVLLSVQYQLCTQEISTNRKSRCFTNNFLHFLITKASSMFLLYLYCFVYKYNITFSLNFFSCTVLFILPSFTCKVQNMFFMFCNLSFFISFSASFYIT